VRRSIEHGTTAVHAGRIVRKETDDAGHGVERATGPRHFRRPDQAAGGR
jgi:hypothetical protein